jgi:cytidylate kinase
MSASQRKLAIAMDGPCASGKTTTAEAVAQRLGYLHIDTGAMYRALALKAVREDVSLDDARELEAFLGRTSVDCVVRAGSCRVLLDGVDVTDEIRESDVSLRSSEIAALPQVRRWLVARQRKLAAGGGVVMEGRDIGTVVLPDADLKIYLDAVSAERAKRRWLEERGTGGGKSRHEVLKEMEERDRRDMTRENSPLEVAPGAVRIDTTGLTIDEQVEEVLKEVKRVLAGGGSGEGQ